MEKGDPNTKLELKGGFRSEQRRDGGERLTTVTKRRERNTTKKKRPLVGKSKETLGTQPEGGTRPQKKGTGPPVGGKKDRIEEKEKGQNMFVGLVEGIAWR